MYSGSGFTGRVLSDGCMDAWSYTMFDEPKVGGMGEGTPPTSNQELFVYCPGRTTTSVNDIPTEQDTAEEYYTLTGLRVDASSLTPGIYIVRKGGTTIKKAIR